jgi:HEAT repeat protein
MKVSRSLIMTMFAFIVALIALAIARPNLRSSAIAAANEKLLRDPRPPERSPLVVPTTVLASSPTLFTGYQPQPQAAAAADEKRRLRFAGRNFEEWQSILMTELEPKRRAEALAALGRFGAFGYEDDASAAIARFLSKARLIRTDEEDQKVERAAGEAFNRIGSQSLKATVQLLKDKSPEVRRLATEIVSSLLMEESVPQPSAAQALVEATTDSEEQVRQEALQALARTFGTNKTPDRSVVFSAATKMLQDNSPRIRANAAQILGSPGSSAAGTVLALLATLKDPRNEETGILVFDINGSVIDALVQRGAAPAIVVPALVKLLPQARADVRTLQRITATLGRLKSAAAPAVPALIEALKRADHTEFQGVGELSGQQSELQHAAVRVIAQALAEIGPTPDSPLARTVLQEKLSKLVKNPDPAIGKSTIDAIVRALQTLSPQESTKSPLGG